MDNFKEHDKNHIGNIGNIVYLWERKEQIMNPQNLMIGNYILYEGREIMVTIATLSSMRACCNKAKFKPIPLNYNQLRSLKGFLAFGETEDLIVIDRFYLKHFPQYNYYYVTDAETGAYLTKVSFVHEWQQFFHTMQGIKLVKK